MRGDLIAPHGGTLVNLLMDADRAAQLQAESRDWPSWSLTPRQLCDLELLLTGGFSPLRGFMCRNDYERVCASMRLSNGILWPIPVPLDVPEELAGSLGRGAKLALRDPEGAFLAALRVEEVWKPDRCAEAEAVYGTMEPDHPGVRHLIERTHPYYVGGRIDGVRLPAHYDFRSLRLSPAELRDEFERLGWRRVVAFQTRNPLHRVHQELTLRAVKDLDSRLLIHPVVGMTKPGDVDHYTRVRCVQAILSRYPPDTVKLALLPLAMRMAGPREALWHAIVRKNHGCTHLIVRRDHAGPGTDSRGKPFYHPYAAQELLHEYEADLGVIAVPFKEMVYAEDRKTFVPEDEVPPGMRTARISGTELRRLLADGREIPEWFTFPEVAQELRRSHPPRIRQGFTVLFTGLPAAGKSTIANVLVARFLESGNRPVTLLDGDVVRKHLSSELGFSKEHRDLNIRRIGYVASEITRHGGIAICAPIAPYDNVRKEVRALIEPLGGFVLVHVATPLEVCERRDSKGLYAKARAGLVRAFTGISDPYEPPDDAEVVVDCTSATPEDLARKIILHLKHEGYVEMNAG
jgi:sulfate adenylyltransferase